MKRVLSIMIAIIITLCSSAPFSYALNDEYIDTNNTYTSSSGYATREQAVACFIDTVGIDRFRADSSILNRYSDKDKISFACLDEMAAAVYSGLIKGYDDNTLKPQGPITRAEALVILNRALSHTDLPSRYTTTFSDTPKWAETQINRLAAAGIVKGYGDGTLGASDYMTLEQVSLLCERIERFEGPWGDYYDYVNSEWLGYTTLSDGSSSQSDVSRLSQTINTQITDIIYSLYHRHYNDGEKFDPASKEQNIINVYSAAANQGLRDSLGFSPIAPTLSSIDKISNISELVLTMANLEKDGFTTMLSITLDTDIYNSDVYIPCISGCYTGLDYNLFTDEDSEKYISYYSDYIETLFKLSGDSNPETSAKSAIAISKTLSNAVTAANGISDISLTAKRLSISELKKFFPHFDIGQYMTNLGLGKAKKYNDI